MTVTVKMIIEVTEGVLNSSDMHELVLETLVDAGVNVYFMSTENVDDSEENGHVAEYWNSQLYPKQTPELWDDVEITSTGHTEGDTDEEV